MKQHLMQQLMGNGRKTSTPALLGLILLGLAAGCSQPLPIIPPPPPEPTPEGENDLVILENSQKILFFRETFTDPETYQERWVVRNELVDQLPGLCLDFRSSYVALDDAGFLDLQAEARNHGLACPDRLASQVYTSQQNFGNGNYRVRLRCDPVEATICAAYLLSDTTHDEIDLIEIYTDQNGRIWLWFVVHVGVPGKIPEERYKITCPATGLGIDVRDWHEYEVAWSQNSIKFYLDGRRIVPGSNRCFEETRKTPFVPQPQPMRLRLEYRYVPWSTPPLTSGLKHAAVDWVRFAADSPPPTPPPP
ncbi:MAG: glycoside hydrolase family 16 protein, partial [Deinococcus sp.]|nr:glycoside hydrolase family 16 protein [Deinococcus sp.]